MTINNCHHCGSDKIQVHLMWLECQECHALGPECTTEQEAIEAWNKPGDRIKELEAIQQVHIGTIATNENVIHQLDGQIKELKEALYNLLNDCINFDDGILTPVFQEDAAKLLDKHNF